MNLSLVDDGFGNLLEVCGSWYLEHPEAMVPKGMIRANYGAALRFVHGHWHQPDYVPNYAVEIAPGLSVQRGGHFGPDCGRTALASISEKVLNEKPINSGNEAVRIVYRVPDSHRHYAEFPNSHGHHYAYNGKAGRILCGAGAEGVYVHFDGMAPMTYVGCNTDWCEFL